MIEHYQHVPRRRRWLLALGMYMLDAKGRDFSWGASDCVHFVLGAAHAQTGVDYKKLLPEYESARSANAALRRLGGHMEAASAIMQPIDQAETGDVVLVEWREMQQRGWDFIFGVQVYECIYVPRQQGLMTLPASSAIMAWSPTHVNPELLA